jgi:hypothetical protein
VQTCIPAKTLWRDYNFAAFEDDIKIAGICSVNESSICFKKRPEWYHAEILPRFLEKEKCGELSGHEDDVKQ